MLGSHKGPDTRQARPCQDPVIRQTAVPWQGNRDSAIQLSVRLWHGMTAGGMGWLEMTAGGGSLLVRIHEYAINMTMCVSLLT